MHITRPHEPIGRGWDIQFYELIRSAERDLLICSPYVSRRGVELLLGNLSEPLLNNGRLTLLTDLSPLAACEGATDPAAVADLAARIPAASVVHLPRLHAKVYIADASRAIVTSGNLTAGGLFRNFEYGIESRDAAIVAEIVSDLQGYACLGALLDQSCLERYREIVDRARLAYKNYRAEVAGFSQGAVYRLIGEAQDELTRNRLSRGSMQSVFSTTILYILNNHGALNTKEMHPFVK